MDDTKVSQLLKEVGQEVQDDREDLVRKALKRSLSQLTEAQDVFKVRREQHCKLVADIRQGKFDYVGERHWEMNRGR